MGGFFKQSELIAKAPIPKLPQCGACGLLNTCQSPKMPVYGKGERKILIIGEAPGAEEDATGKPFQGPAGQTLQKTLAKCGIDMRRDCWVTNSLICRPPKNATPTPKQIGYCRPNLVNAVTELKPEIIVPLGGAAIKSLIEWIWKGDAKNISRWVGWHIPYQKLNCWICPTYHPSYILRFEKNNRLGTSVEKLFFDMHWEAISKLEGRPWEKIPQYEKEVEIIFSTKEASEIIRAFIEYGEIAAFDFETNMLKPDWPDAEIISASIACQFGDQRRTIAFPWVGPVIPVFREFVRCNRIKKIASNLKMEDRWCRKLLNTPVRNWFWDTMNGAHVEDNRPDITGLKFQAFVRLGVDAHDDPVRQFLKAKGNQRINRIVRNVDLGRLLLYNGLDSLYELLICPIQRKAMKYD